MIDTKRIFADYKKTFIEALEHVINYYIFSILAVHMGKKFKPSKKQFSNFLNKIYNAILSKIEIMQCMVSVINNQF